MGNNWKGRTHSAATKAKISAALKDRNSGAAGVRVTAGSLARPRPAKRAPKEKGLVGPGTTVGRGGMKTPQGQKLRKALLLTKQSRRRAEPHSAGRPDEAKLQNRLGGSRKIFSGEVGRQHEYRSTVGYHNRPGGVHSIKVQTVKPSVRASVVKRRRMGGR